MAKAPPKNRAHTFEPGEKVTVVTDMHEEDLIEGEVGTVVSANGDKYVVRFGTREVRLRGRNILRY